MTDHESHGGGGRVRSITPDLDNELNGLNECAVAFGVAQSTFRAAVARMRAAGDERERDFIRNEIRGFTRRLALGMLALAMSSVDDQPTIALKEDP